MKEIGYYNGEMGELSQIKIPMQDRAMFFGDGVYDVTFAHDRKMFAIDDHLDRFYSSLALLEIPFTMTREELQAELQKCVDAADTNEELFVYWQSSRGNCKRNHVYPPKSEKPTLLITITACKPLDYSKAIRLITVDDTRFYHCNIKTLNLIPNVVASQRALEADCQEAVLHRGDNVTECAHSSLLILKNGHLIAPPLDELILPSISRKHIIELCHTMDIPVDIRRISMAELMEADEIIVCSSSKLCVRACEIDNKSVGMKDPELFEKIQHTYFNRVADECGLVLTV